MIAGVKERGKRLGENEWDGTLRIIELAWIGG